MAYLYKKKQTEKQHHKILVTSPVKLLWKTEVFRNLNASNQHRQELMSGRSCDFAS